MTTETLRTTVTARRAGAVTWVRVRPLVIHVVLAASALVMLYPVIWMVVSSLRPGNEIFRDPGILVKDLRIDNYRIGWNALTEPFTRYLLNSALVVLGSILGNLVSCSMAAYAFARLEFTAKKLWFGIML
ncbi:MAG TPA: carbohydrate ABC transporter permease, partial [Kribbella sp.]|nr:carbohydrate ABC transporter permease [Kribbella sp.]